MVEPTHLKNMRKSNWIISPGIGVKIPQNIWNHHQILLLVVFRTIPTACFNKANKKAHAAAVHLGLQ